MLDFGREICGDLRVAEKREWLVTNGIGGFASGTIPGILTRRYHGLLIAALQPPVERTLLLTKLDETVEYDGIYPKNGRFYPLHTNAWTSGSVEPNGFSHLSRFHLEGTTPVWTYSIGNALLEKRIWMAQGENTTYIQYHLARATGPLTLEAKTFVNYRDFHLTTIVSDWWPEIMPFGDNGLSYTIFNGARPFYLFHDSSRLQDPVEMTPQFDWYEDFLLSVEEYRGQNDIQEDHIYATLIRAVIRPQETMTLIASVEETPLLDGAEAYAKQKAHEQALLDQARQAWAGVTLPAPLAHLVLAADQFIVRRGTAQNPNGRSVIAGYHWFSDWGRDTMIALPGLTLTTGRPEIAASILRTFAQFVDQGMLPNRFPDAGETPEYNTVDATLWYFEAIRAYFAATGDKTILQDLFPILQDIIQWHQKGTRYNIHMDDSDGLIYAGEEGVQLTWMDAKVSNWVVTPRIGKPVEISALWYNALHCMAEFASALGQSGEMYLTLAEKTKAGFQRFWQAELGFCADVLDSGPEKNIPEGNLRPNQLFAIALPYSPLTPEQQRSALDACSRLLLTSHGLRSLSPDDKAYIGHYGGDRYKRDGAYHQGTVWGWLIGPFVSAHLRVYQNPAEARSYLLPLLHHLDGHGVGSLSEIFDGDPPFTPRGCIAQAWSVAEVLRLWQATESSANGVAS